MSNSTRNGSVDLCISTVHSIRMVDSYCTAIYTRYCQFHAIVDHAIIPDMGSNATFEHHPPDLVLEWK